MSVTDFIDPSECLYVSLSTQNNLHASQFIFRKCRVISL